MWCLYVWMWSENVGTHLKSLQFLILCWWTWLVGSTRCLKSTFKLGFSISRLQHAWEISTHLVGSVWLNIPFFSFFHLGSVWFAGAKLEWNGQMLVQMLGLLEIAGIYSINEIIINQFWWMTISLGAHSNELNNILELSETIQFDLLDFFDRYWEDGIAERNDYPV